MDEHFVLLDLAGDVRRHLGEGANADAIPALRRLSDLLDRHVRREERGVFAALKEQGEFTDAVEELEHEHVTLDAQIAALDPSDADFAEQVGRIVRFLSDHIDKENLGVFPVAVVTLGADEWETVSTAHAEEPSFLRTGQLPG